MIQKVLVIIFLLSAGLTAQVTSIPEYPTEYDSIKIIFKASALGGSELVGYTGVLYTHTGVITNLSGGQWSHVIGSWGNNQTQPALERIGTDLYELNIGLPREFYDVTDEGEEIQQLAFVFRSADGTKQSRPDIFVNMYGINIVINNLPAVLSYGDPLRNPGLVSPGDTLNIDINAIATGTIISSVRLLIDDTEVAQSPESLLNYNFVADNYTQGIHNAVVIAADTGAIRDTSRFAVVVNPPIVNESLPAGTRPGININSNSSVTLALFAPYKKFVYLLGSFNDWKVNTDYYMKKYEVNSDSVVWHLTLDNLSAGTEYIFQYYVDGEIRIADPYSEKVLDPWNDRYISTSTYPGLTAYPYGKTNEPLTAFRTDIELYQWNVENFERPKKTDLVIYELLLRDFLSTHDFKTLMDTINYLKNLGINAIELMPVNEFEGNESWGYNTSFYFAPDKYYGPAEDLKAFIDYAHEQGMAVIIDMVLNHSYGQSPLVRLYWNSTLKRPAANNPWYNQVSPNPDYSWGYDFNHESIHTKNLVDRVTSYWINEFKVDGFRFDFTKGFTNTPGDPSYDTRRIELVTRMANEIFAIDSTIYVILEHWADNNEETILANRGMMLWGNINYQYNEATMGNPSDLTWGSYKARGWQKPHLVSFMESHDEERLMVKNLLYGKSTSAYNIRDIRVALNRIKLAAAFFLTIPGPKMIWQFGELGYDVSIDYDCRTCNKPIRWYYFDDPARNNLYKVFSALNKLRTEYDAFESTNYEANLSTSLKRIKISHPTMDVVIIGNFGISQAAINPSFTKQGMWYDFFSSDSMMVNDPTQFRSLEPGEFHIYTSVKIPSPEPGILSDAGDSERELTAVETYDLGQNYPNPFNPSTVIKYQVPEPSHVTIKVFDVTGREVRTLLNEELEMGQYELIFDASGLSSGVYFYKIDAPGYSSVKKMLLLK